MISYYHLHAIHFINILQHFKNKFKLRNDSESLDESERLIARLKMAELPRNGNPTRVRNRCATTGRPRGYYRKFGLNRIELRDLANKGLIPGVTKSSW